VKIDWIHAQGIAEAARKACPREACGVVYYSAVWDAITATFPCRNTASRLGRFEIDRADLLELVASLHLLPGDELGLYHSHAREPAEPSENDRERIGAWAAGPYLVYSCETIELTAWRISDRAVARQVALEIV
jgi:proteasome lid subunit RPN8/RPN11